MQQQKLNIDMTTTEVCFSVDCLFRKQKRSRVVCLLNLSATTMFQWLFAEKILSPQDSLKSRTLFVISHKFLLRNNAFILFQKSDTEKPNTSRFKAPAVESGWLLEGRSLTILTSLRSERPELLLRTRPMGDWGKGEWGSADNPDQSAVREIRHRNRDRPRREKTREREKGTNQEDEKGGESSADNPDQSAVREARHHQGRGSGVGQTAERGWGQKRGGSKAQTFKLRVDKCWIANSKQ